ncbi:MAG: FHA domain-containing protein [Acidobacteriaceae bacterium]|nr:FHA domain-containing protein [Acidobacteriaceae bacterium]
MPISDVIERIGKAIFEAPFGGARIVNDAPELAEIRLAMLDAVKAKSHRAGGKLVFPYSLVRVRLLGVPEEQAAVFQSEFLANYFAGELKTALARSHYRFSDELRVNVETTPELPLKGKDWVSVDVETRPRQGNESVHVDRKPAKLIILNGKANRSELVLAKNRINIGRTTEVFRGSGPSRRNDLVFTEDNEVNRTVSREHAHIVYSEKTGEYRIFNDRSYKVESDCRLWIVRAGLSQPVHRGNRGTLLESGDEIHLGSAVMRFQTK